MSLYTKIKPKKEDKKEEKEDKGILIAVADIDGKEHNVYWTDNYQGDSVDVLKVKNARSIPIKQTNQIYSAFLSGSSGSGKSTEAARIALDLLNSDKSIENVFFITSQTIDDPADYEVLPKQVEKLMTDFVRGIITMGRKLNINPIIIRHKVMNGLNKTSEIIMEARNVILFPQYNYRDSSKFLESYMGFSRDELQDVRKLKTRVLHLHKVIPNFMISSDEIRLL